MTLSELLEKTVVFLGLEDKPLHGIGMIWDKENDHGFLMFSKLKDNCGLDFGEEIDPEQQESDNAENLLDAIFFNDIKAWDNFVHIVNHLDKNMKIERETHKKEVQHD